MPAASREAQACSHEYLLHVRALRPTARDFPVFNVVLPKVWRVLQVNPSEEEGRSITAKATATHAAFKRVKEEGDGGTPLPAMKAGPGG